MAERIRAVLKYQSAMRAIRYEARKCVLMALFVRYQSAMRAIRYEVPEAVNAYFDRKRYQSAMRAIRYEVPGIQQLRRLHSLSINPLCVQ